MGLTYLTLKDEKEGLFSMTPDTLIAFAKCTQNIADFVSSPDLNEVISTIIGDVHVDAARLALDTAKITSNPRERLNSVITHLEAAHSAYARIYINATFIQLSYNHVELDCIVSRDAWVCCVMALCYARLGEFQAAGNSLRLAKAAFKYDSANQTEDWELKALPALPLSILAIFKLVDPKFWKNKELISEEKVAEFAATLQKVMGLTT